MEQKVNKIDNSSVFGYAESIRPSLSDLITDPGTGMLSHTKLWAHVAYLVVTLAFVKVTFTTPEPDLTVWLLYLCVVGGHSSLSKLISMKYK